MLLKSKKIVKQQHLTYDDNYKKLPAEGTDFVELVSFQNIYDKPNIEWHYKVRDAS